MHMPIFNVRCSKHKEDSMLGWIILLLILSFIAAVFGFGGIAVAAAGIAKILFFIFVVLFLISLIAYLARGRGPKV
jgi:uncharacterized membrane protein YtjA (UPF0391 family)